MASAASYGSAHVQRNIAESIGSSINGGGSLWYRNWRKIAQSTNGRNSARDGMAAKAAIIKERVMAAAKRHHNQRGIA